MLRIREIAALLGFTLWSFAFLALCASRFFEYEIVIVLLVLAVLAAIVATLVHLVVTILLVITGRLPLPRFSLRAVLMAVTLVAAAFGLATWLTKR